MKRPHAELIKQWADGADIEEFLYHPGDWFEQPTPNWNPTTQYRVRPTPSIIPFTFEDRDMLRGKWVKFKEGGIESVVTTISKKEVIIGEWRLSYAELLDQCDFLDGSPCGKQK